MSRCQATWCRSVIYCWSKLRRGELLVRTWTLYLVKIESFATYFKLSTKHTNLCTKHLLYLIQNIPKSYQMSLILIFKFSTSHWLPKQTIKLKYFNFFKAYQLNPPTPNFTYPLPSLNTPFHFIYTDFGTLCTSMSYKLQNITINYPNYTTFFINYHSNMLDPKCMLMMFNLTHICIHV